jgi:hypothetical protein
MGKMKGGCFLFWIISNLIEKKNRFLSAKVVFPVSSVNQRFLQRKGGPMPGQKNIRLAKKGGGLSVHKAGFRRFQPNHPLPPASLCGKEAGGKWEDLIPAVFVFGACSFARATRRPV